MKQLFVLVATGQNVANLPPVLETANCGDGFVFLESPAAKRGGRATGAVKVIKKFGLQEFTPISVDEINDPSDVAKACQQTAQKYREGMLPVIIANGRTKLTPVGLLQAWQDQAPNSSPFSLFAR